MKRFLALIIAVVLLFSFSACRNDKADSKSKKTTISSAEFKKSNKANDNVKYTTGVVDGQYYINEWANLKFKMTDEWYDMPEIHSDYEDENTDCGFAYAKTDVGKHFFFNYENVAGKSIKNGRQYIKEAQANFTTSLENSGGTVFGSNEFTMKIAGEDFAVVRITFESPEKLHIYFLICSRVKDDRAIVIGIMGQGSREISRVINTIKEAN